MTKAQVEVITSVQRRRRWSTAEKEWIVAAAIEPGAVASEVARAAGIHTSQLFRWRQQFCGPPQSTPTFTPVSVAPGLSPVPVLPSPVMPSVIEIRNPARERWNTVALPPPVWLFRIFSHRFDVAKKPSIRGLSQTNLRTTRARLRLEILSVRSFLSKPPDCADLVWFP
jgi:transposase